MTRAQRAFAIRLLAGLQTRMKGEDVSVALEPQNVAALMEVADNDNSISSEGGLQVIER